MSHASARACANRHLNVQAHTPWPCPALYPLQHTPCPPACARAAHPVPAHLLHVLSCSLCPPFVVGMGRATLSWHVSCVVRLTRPRRQLFAIIVFGCVSDRGRDSSICHTSTGDGNVCGYGIGIPVIAFILAILFVITDIFDVRSCPPPRLATACSLSVSACTSATHSDYLCSTSWVPSGESSASSNLL
jgi:hypothetical protein